MWMPGGTYRIPRIGRSAQKPLGFCNIGARGRTGKIVITNYHAFMLREKMNLMKGTRALLQGHNSPIKSTETEGQMIQRVMQELMHIKNIMVINDEAHHCYREKPDDEDTVDDLRGDEKQEAKENNETARVWISGLETVKRRLGNNAVIDLSATPFFLRGSGYGEGTLLHSLGAVKKQVKR